MASLAELQKKAQKKGIVPQIQSQKETGADQVVESYVLTYTPEGALKKSIDSLDSFCSYWEEQAKDRDKLKSAVEYIDQVNTIYSSYRTMRKNLDGTIAYLIGEWLLECRSKFFPQNDRKSRGQWFSFLKSHLCQGFEKTTAYEFMSIAEKLKNYRQSKLPLHTLKALLRACNSGVDITTIDINNISSKAILALREQVEVSEGLMSKKVYRLRMNLDSFLKEAEKFDLSQIDLEEMRKLRYSLFQLDELCKFHSAPRNEIMT